MRPSMARLWEIVGGSDKGGIVVRDGQELSSTQLPDRLSHGSTVEELSLSGERLNYRRVTGSGPDQGWISIKLKGKELARVIEKERVPKASGIIQSSSRQDLCNAIFTRYCSGDLDTLISEYHELILGITRLDMTPPNETTIRGSGVPTPFSDKYGPLAESGSKTRLLLHGDSITHGSPVIPSASFALALASRNSDIFIENAGWGGLMSMSLAHPGDFDTAFGQLPLPNPCDFRCQYACIMIGTNDAMCVAGGDQFAHMSQVKKPFGGANLPEDWKTRCRPSPELFEKSLQAAVRGLAAGNPGIRIALVTLPMLGEDVDETCEKANARPPFAVVSDFSAAVHRIAKAEDCVVLPLFECMVHHMSECEKKGRKLLKWSGMKFMRRMAHQGEEIKKAKELGAQEGGKQLVFDDTGNLKGEHPIFLPDLVHFNERAAALHATLVQTWLDFELQ